MPRNTGLCPGQEPGPPFKAAKMIGGAFGRARGWFGYGGRLHKQGVARRMRQRGWR